MIRFLAIYSATVLIGWLGWNAAVAMGVGWSPLPFPQALAGMSLLWIVFAGYSFAANERSD